MKCSGKQQTYPSEIEALNKKIKEQKFVDVIDQAEVNKKNLKMLDQKLHSEAENLTVTFENEIGNVEKNIRNRNEKFKEQLKSLTSEMNNIRTNFTETIQRVEKQSMTHFTALSSQIGSQSTVSKGRPSHFTQHSAKP